MAFSGNCSLFSGCYRVTLVSCVLRYVGQLCRLEILRLRNFSSEVHVLTSVQPSSWLSHLIVTRSASLSQDLLLSHQHSFFLLDRWRLSLLQSGSQTRTCRRRSPREGSTVGRRRIRCFTPKLWCFADPSTTSRRSGPHSSPSQEAEQVLLLDVLRLQLHHHCQRPLAHHEVSPCTPSYGQCLAFLSEEQPWQQKWLQRPASFWTIDSLSQKLLG